VLFGEEEEKGEEKKLFKVDLLSLNLEFVVLGVKPLCFQDGKCYCKYY
jgi:hypothetical protein